MQFLHGISLLQRIFRLRQATQALSGAGPRTLARAAGARTGWADLHGWPPAAAWLSVYYCGLCFRATLARWVWEWLGHIGVGESVSPARGVLFYVLGCFPGGSGSGTGMVTACGWERAASGFKGRLRRCACGCNGSPYSENFVDLIGRKCRPRSYLRERLQRFRVILQLGPTLPELEGAQGPRRATAVNDAASSWERGFDIAFMEFCRPLFFSLPTGSTQCPCWHPTVETVGMPSYIARSAES